MNYILFNILLYFFLFNILQNLKFPDKIGPGIVRNFVCIGRNESQWKAYIGNQDFKSFQDSNNERKISSFFHFTYFILTKKFCII